MPYLWGMVALIYYQLTLVLVMGRLIEMETDSLVRKEYPDTV